MALFKVVFTKTETYTGYIDANDAQDAISKVRWPHDVNDAGQTIGRYAPGHGTTWDVVQNATSYDFASIKNASTGSDVDLSTVEKQPEAPEAYHATVVAS